MTGEISPAVSRAIASLCIVTPNAAAVCKVAEAARDIQLRIQREQKRQPGGRRRANALLSTRIPPATTQALISHPVAPQDCSGCVMKKLTEPATAKHLIVLGVENEFMPKIIHHLAWHRDKLSPALEIHEKELTKPLRHQLAVFSRQMTMFGPEFLEEAAWQNGTANIGFATKGLISLP